MTDPQLTEDLRWMRRAIKLSTKGFPAPNPHVGCVLVKDGKVVGEGYHHFAGDLHAEANALRKAGEEARGASCYTTLEPCNHYGRQPPCSEALIQAGVSRVVIAVMDPVAGHGGGAEKLRASGVTVDVLPTNYDVVYEAQRANWQFLTAHRSGRPVVVVKAAMSLDGRIALPSGESQWITGEVARLEGHRLRAELGAVLVGRKTVEKDDPQLTARIPKVVNQPTRIVLDPRKVLTGNERIFGPPGGTIQVAGHIDLEALLQGLFKERGITGVLVEGGAITIASFFEAGLVDRVELMIAPKLLGSGPSWVEGLKIPNLAAAPALRILDMRRLGSDLWVSAETRRDIERH